jgi:hypothetical protein
MELVDSWFPNSIYWSRKVAEVKATMCVSFLNTSQVCSIKTLLQVYTFANLNLTRCSTNCRIGNMVQGTVYVIGTLSCQVSYCRREVG